MSLLYSNNPGQVNNLPFIYVGLAKILFKCALSFFVLFSTKVVYLLPRQNAANAENEA